jgi:hypothetical protein
MPRLRKSSRVGAGSSVSFAFQKQNVKLNSFLYIKQYLLSTIAGISDGK